jgi:DNA-binding NtrC family response regulator
MGLSSIELVAKLNLLGESASFRYLLDQIERFAACQATILIQGETGTGKELAARAIHYMSTRGNGPFVPINCGCIPDALIASELFGHSRGAFTDARETHEGLVAEADGGTLFLDELETLSLGGQVALLRFLQDRQYRPLGASSVRTANVRFIGATNEDLGELASHGHFRQDLLYRLNVLSVRVPPLRSRDDDVVLLARAFLHRLTQSYGTAERSLHSNAIDALRRYHWPGNIRELENLIHREFLLTDDLELRLEALARGADDSAADTRSACSRCSDPPPGPVERSPVAPLTGVCFREAKARAIANFEREYVRELLERSDGNVSLAARLAGKERSRLNRLLRKHRISPQSFRRAAGTEASS